MDRAPSISLMGSLSLAYLSRNQNRLKISKLSKISQYGESKTLYIIITNSYINTFWINLPRTKVQESQQNSINCNFLCAMVWLLKRLYSLENQIWLLE